jgi:acetylornithine deacetylase
MSTTEACASLLAELVSFNTVNPGGDEPALCRDLVERLDALGADEVVMGITESPERPGQQGAWTFARFGVPELIVNAHVDTVPVNRGWSRHPHQAEIVDGKLYGLGSADTKGAIAAAMTAACEVRPSGVGLLFSGDEECGATVLPEFLASSHAKPIKRAIVCEPTTRRAGVRHRGVMCYRASLRTAGGHSSKADLMPKPIVLMAKLAVALGELGEEYTKTGPEGMQGLCFNVASLDGGVAFNVIPEQTHVTWSVRHPPGFDVAKLEAEQRQLAASIDPGIEIEKTLDQAPFSLDDPSFFQGLLGDYPQEWVTLDFWTEAAIFGAHGIESVVVGPGNIAQAHAADEFVTLDDLEWAVSMFKDVFARTGQ